MAVKTINKKQQISQVSSILSTGKPFLDTTGIATSHERREPSRSLRQQIRRLSDTGAYFQTHLSIILKTIKEDDPASIELFVEAVQAALSSAASAVETAPPAEVSSISIKKLIASCIVLDGTGQKMLDDVGGDFTVDCFNPTIVRSARQMVRDIMIKNTDNSRCHLATVSGMITKAIATEAPTTISTLKTAINDAITASTSATAKLAAPAQAPATSLLHQIQSMLIIADDGSICINDTDDSGTQAQLGLSEQRELKRLIDSNGEGTPTFKIQFASGIKWAKVAALTAGTASAADVRNALTNAA
jgi:hypothetical protein